MTSKRTTAADLAAAIALGVVPADAEVVTAAEAAEAVRLAAEQATAAAHAEDRAATERDGIAQSLPATHHECGIPGCRHGSHTGTPQPDRQLKLTAPCGAVLRMTGRAYARAGSAVTCGHGDAFTIDATRRAYSRRTA